MRIEYVEGDLIASQEEVVIHGCNIKGGFDTGFAGVLRKRHPGAREAYMTHHRNGGLILGSVVWAYDGRLIGNAMTQPTYGRGGQHVSYEAVAACMRAIDDAARHGVPGGGGDAQGADAAYRPRGCCPPACRRTRRRFGAGAGGGE